MKRPLPDDLLAEFSEFVAARTALHFPPARWRDLERKACSAAQEFEFADVEAFVRWAVSADLTREQLEILASHLTISETYFWREPKVFEALGGRILPELIRAREKGERRLRIWSAGCATGEEPYSIAIALRRALPTPDDWNVTILATDINPKILRRAAAGVYGEWSFRNVPPWLTDGYFRPTKDGKREILPEIRKMVTFAYLNLAEDIYPSPLNNTNAMDMVFCRNVLMYFAPDRAQQIGESLRHALVEGGWLMVGASELSQQLFPQFTSVRFPGAIVYRKHPAGVREQGTGDRGQGSVREQGTGDRGQGSVREQGTGVREQGTGDRGQGSGVPDLRPLSPDPRPLISAPRPLPSAPRSQAPDLRPLISAPWPLPPDPCPQSAIRTLANQGQLAEALAACEQAIAANKLDPGVYYLRATILQELNREGDAMASLKRALYLDPNFVAAHFALGNLALRQADARTGRRCFRNVLALLSARQAEDVLPEAEGLTVGRFREIIHATMQIGALV